MRQRGPVVVDWDGTVADIVVAWLARWNAAHPARPLTPAAIRTYDLRLSVGAAAAEDFGRAIADPALYLASPPLPGALDALRLWRRWGLLWHFATGTTDPAILAAKRRWLRRHAPDLADVPIVPVPPGHKADLPARALVDDNPAEWAAFRASRPGGRIATVPQAYTAAAPPDVLRLPWDGLALALLP